ncbi:MAG TPA: 4-(cytidine 5'-diphospho)-2-C-methyl-D-erythritol kinase [Acidimicrobiales bacterium]|nr:4-(cytidine 5'-diphospho)-2-C-methyl-D-erythritol kinase [Acidimicrobiales bacterium]
MTRLVAPAKLTTALRVLGRREDGYHLLEAEMVSLDLADELELTEGEEGSEVRDLVAWVGLPGTAPPEQAGPPGANLVERALELCGRRARWHLDKHIPTGAGLGGGSSDAAAVLRWAGVADLSVAAGLGADVPFCLVGGRARVSGIGEVVEPLADGEASAFLLVTPRVHVSTPVVYRAFDELGGPRGEHGNDLEPAALAAYPELRWWRDLLGAASGSRPRLAGSGGTWFVEGAAEALGELAEGVRGEIVSGRESAFVRLARRTGPSAVQAARPV